jgi:hypothetical protein
MNMTANQYQKQLDEDGELAIEVERAEQDCREKLLNLERWHYPEKVRPWAVKWQYAGEQDVTEALYDLCHDEIVLALSLLDTDALEAVRILKECRRKAVEDVLGRMDFEAIVKANIEQRDAA